MRQKATQSRADTEEGRAGQTAQGSIGVVRTLRTILSCAGPAIMVVAHDYMKNLSSKSDPGEFENTLLLCDIGKGKRSLWRSEYCRLLYNGCNLR